MSDTKIKTSNIGNLAVTHALLHTDMDLTSKTVQVATPTSNTHPATKAYVDTEVANLIDSAPGTLDTLNELAAAIGDDANFAATVTTGLSNKLPLAGGTMTGVIAGFESTGIDDNAANTSVTILSDGKVGIGIESPVRTLDVDSSISSDIARFGNDSGTYTLGYTTDLASIDLASSAGLRVRSGGTLAFQTTSAGHVGIGTSQPDLTLHVDGVNGYPATSGSNPVGHIAIRAKNESSSHGATIGVANASPWGTWIQAQDAGNLATNYPLLLNPNGGNVGIGTSSPSAKIDASGTYRMQLRTDDAIPELRSITTNGAAFKELGLNGLDLRFYTSSSERMRIDSNGDVTLKSAGVVTLKASPLNSLYGAGFNVMTVTGTGSAPYTSTIGFSNYSNTNAMVIQGTNVGIGTTNPLATLDVNGVIRHTTEIESNSVYKAFSIGSNRATNDYGGLNKEYWAMSVETPGPATTGESSHHAYGALKFSGVSTSDTTLDDVLVLRHNGNVGIGTNVPQTKLHISGVSENIRLDNTGTSNYGLEIWRGGNKGASIAWGEGNANLEIKNYRNDSQAHGPYANIDFFTGGTNATNPNYNPDLRMRIQQTGEVGIGTSNPTAKLHVEGTIYANNGHQVKSVTTVGTGLGENRYRYFRHISTGIGSETFKLIRYSRHWWGTGWFQIIVRGTYYGSNSKYGVFTVNGHTRSGLASVQSHINNVGTATPFADNYNSTHEACDISITLPAYEQYNIEFNILASSPQTAEANVGHHLGNSNAFFLHGNVKEFI